MRTAKLLVTVGITFLLAGCKLAVIVVEGGEVQSDSVGTCVAGTICVVDVTDEDFSETFTAVPDEGWYFHKWNAGDRFICGNDTLRWCRASNLQHIEITQAVKDLVASSETFYLMPVFKRYPRATVVDGVPGRIKVDGEEWQWLQPKDFGGYSYNEVSAVCPKGVCSGALPGSTVDLTGYRWASSDDVGLLVQAYEAAKKPIQGDFGYMGVDKYAYIWVAMLSDPPWSEGLGRRYWSFWVVGVSPPDATKEDVGLVPDFLSNGSPPWFWRTVKDDF